MTGKWVAHHDDGCTKRLLINGWCEDCKLFPDMQSVALYLYCPKCDVHVKENKCPSCGRKIERPD